MTLQEINDQLKALTVELDAIVAMEEPELSDADKAEELSAQIKVLEEQRAKFQVIEQSRTKKHAAPKPTIVKVGVPPVEAHKDGVQLHAGAFLVAAFNPEQRGAYKDLTGVDFHTHEMRDNNTGGIFVPTEVSKTVIDLQKQYGVFVRDAQTEKMNSETLMIPRFGTDVTAYWGAENVTKTLSDLGAVDGVTLTARNLYAYGRITEQLIMNSAVDIGDRWIRSASRASAYKIDQAAFLGDGTSTYGGIRGFAQSFLALSGTIANIAGLTVAAGNTFDEFTIGNFTTCKNTLTEQAHANAKWYVNRRVWGATIERLALALGGVTAAEVTGSIGSRFLGYPVEFVEVMPSVDANSQVAVLFGDMKLAAALGDRQAISIKQDTSLGFATNTIHIKQDQYLDIAVHSVGNASASAGSRVAGPMVGIISAAS